MLVAASAIYFLNLHSDVLINRLYCDDVGWYKEKKEEVAEMEVDPERDQRMRTIYKILVGNQSHLLETHLLYTCLSCSCPQKFRASWATHYGAIIFIEFFDAMSLPMAIALSGQPLLG
ncbi:hypothetical protein ACSBR2_015610 [Camellia fascicularis]